MTLPIASNNSSPKGSSLPELSIGDQSVTCSPAMSAASRNVIGLPASAGGPTLFDWLDGRTIGGPGPDHAPASPSPSPAYKPDLPTSGTSGLPGTGLSASASLQQSLENKLRALPFGSTDYTLTWKARILPSGRQICRLHASAQSTAGLDSTLLRTPSGTSNHGKNHVAGRLDEWGGRGNPFRGTSLGKVHCPAFEFWVMGYHEAWPRLMQRETQSSHSLPPNSSVQP